MSKTLGAIVLGLGMAYSTAATADPCKQYPTLQGKRIAVVTEGRMQGYESSVSLMIYGKLTKETCDYLFLKNSNVGRPSLTPKKSDRPSYLKSIILKKRVIGIHELAK